MRFVLALAMLIPCRAAILDRIAVTVGKQVITESDLITDIRVSEFLDQAPVDLSGARKRKAAERLVDQTLILQDAAASRTALASNDDADRALNEVKTQYGGEEKYRAALTRYGISGDEVTAHLLAGLRAMRYADLRFRPEIQLTDDEIQNFYRTLTAQAKKKGEPVGPLKDSRPQVEKLLTDQRAAQALDEWLKTRRAEVQVVYREEVFE